MSASTLHIVRYFLVAICGLLIVTTPCQSDDLRRDSRHILILHSFHPGFPWTDQIMAGMQEALKESPFHLTVDVEYLDTKRHHDSEYFYHVLDAILHYKLKHRTYDLVLLSDNGALNFALEHRNKLLKSTPIVFSGISCDNHALVSGKSQITGVRADPDFTGVIEQALALHPLTKQMVVIGSTKDLSDRVNFIRMQAVAQQLSSRVAFDFWNDLPSEYLQEKLATLQAGSVLLINGSIRDKYGDLLSFEEQMRLLRTRALVPIYSFWDVYLNEGVVGGSLVHAKTQGIQAGKLALRILQGESAGAIPVQPVVRETPRFDYNMLKKHGISQSQLPDKHLLINTPPSSYEINKSQFWLAAALLCASILLSIILTRNIMKRKQAEALLRTSEQSYKQLSQQFQIILDGIPDGLTLISSDMKVIWSNKGAGNYFNRTLGSIPGEYCCKLLYNRTSLCDNCPALNVFESKKDEEAIITTPDGRILEVKAFPIKGADGVVSQAIMLASDVTEKHRLVEESVRNGRLASLGELAAGVAHEINNPNALIILNTDLLRKMCLDIKPILQDYFERYGEFTLSGLPYTEMREELPHLFGEMLESASRIKRIVHDLKDFSRPDGPVLKEAIDLNEAVRTSVRLTGNTIRQATENFSCVLADSLPPFLGNLQRIEQVVVNLLMNACQSLPDRNNGIAVTTYYDEERNASVIKIADEGRGISKENLPHIMDPFFTTKREHGGTGLGLSVSLRIVRDHGGTLEFVSEVNKGTFAYVYLPVYQEAQPDE